MTATLPKEIVDLIEAVAELPNESRAAIAEPLDAVIGSCDRRRRVLELVQESLSSLRMDVKYMMFDLEATRRERDEARTKLD